MQAMATVASGIKAAPVEKPSRKWIKTHRIVAILIRDAKNLIHRRGTIKRPEAMAATDHPRWGRAMFAQARDKINNSSKNSWFEKLGMSI